MADELVDQILRDHAAMEANRLTFESHWQEIAERIFPRAAVFNVEMQPGAKNTEKMFDATAALGLERFAAAMDSMVTPRTQRWHGLEPEDEELADDYEIMRWCEAVTAILFKTRYSARANFVSQAYENYMSLGAFGTGPMFVDDVLGQGIRYSALHLSEIYFSQSFSGMVDKVHRKFELTARQAVQQFGERCPPKIAEEAEKNGEKKFKFLHCVKPREEYPKGGRDKSWRSMPFASYYVSVDEKAIVGEGGYNSMPYAVSRYVTQARETYGRSPAMTVLPDIKMLNEMQKTIIRAGHLAVEPPLLLQEDGALSAFNLRPGALNFGGVDDQGRQVVHPLQNGARLDYGLELLTEKRRIINDAFLVTLFQILVQDPGTMTATEVMTRLQEKGQLLGPAMGRQQSEMLGPIIERELDILSRANALPPMPDKLREAGGLVNIRYTAPINRAQRAEEGVAILRTLEAIAPIAQQDKSVLSIFKKKETARELADINGMPKKLLFSDEEMEAIEEAEAEATAQQNMLAAAPVAANAAKSMAEAQAIQANNPMGQLPSLTIQ